MLEGVMHGADVQDLDGAPGMIERSVMHIPPYPAIAQSWQGAWAGVIPFFAFPDEVRRIVYTTNAIEALTPSSSGQSAPGAHFSSNEAATKLFYLILNRSEKEWSEAAYELAT